MQLPSSRLLRRLFEVITSWLHGNHNQVEFINRIHKREFITRRNSLNFPYVSQANQFDPLSRLKGCVGCRISVAGYRLNFRRLIAATRFERSIIQNEFTEDYSVNTIQWILFGVNNLLQAANTSLVWHLGCQVAITGIREFQVDCVIDRSTSACSCYRRSCSSQRTTDALGCSPAD